MARGKTAHRAAWRVRVTRRFVLGAATIAIGTAAASALHAREWRDRDAWVAVWGASPQQPIDPLAALLGNPTPLTLTNQTIRQVARISAGGHRLRLRLTNEYTDAPTVIGSVHIAQSRANGTASGAIVPGTDQVITFGGEAGITLAPNAPVLSDPIDVDARALSSLAISIYVASGTQPTTPHSLGQQTAYIVAGDRTGAEDLSAGTATEARYLLSDIEAIRRDGATIATLGDSITDGYHSTVDADHRWPDYLADRLHAAGLRDIGVADEGISGNRLRSEGIGPNAQSRFDRDVLALPGIRYVTVLEGINDIGLPVLAGGPAPTPEDLIATYKQLIARAHQASLLIFGCTLTPFKGAAYYSANGEATRETVNTWIRTSGAFDAVIDFDRATRDPANPTMFLPAYDSGDHLHPNDAGYAAMAQAVPLRLFEGGGR